MPSRALTICSLFVLTFTGCRGVGESLTAWLPEKQDRYVAGEPAAAAEMRPNSRAEEPRPPIEQVSFSEDAAPASSGKIQQLTENGQQAISTGDYPRARSAFRHVLTLDPGNSDAHHGLAIVADLTEDWQEAESHYKQALRSRPADPNLLHDLGYSYLLQSRYHESAQYLRQAVDQNPDYELAHLHLAMLSLMRGNNAEAEQRLASLYPQHVVGQQMVSLRDQITELQRRSSEAGLQSGASFEQMMEVAAARRREGQQARRERAMGRDGLRNDRPSPGGSYGNGPSAPGAITGAPVSSTSYGNPTAMTGASQQGASQQGALQQGALQQGGLPSSGGAWPGAPAAGYAADGRPISVLPQGSANSGMHGTSAPAGGAAGQGMMNGGAAAMTPWPNPAPAGYPNQTATPPPTNGGAGYPMGQPASPGAQPSSSVPMPSTNPAMSGGIPSSAATMNNTFGNTPADATGNPAYGGMPTAPAGYTNPATTAPGAAATGGTQQPLIVHPTGMYNSSSQTGSLQGGGGFQTPSGVSGAGLNAGLNAASGNPFPTGNSGGNAAGMMMPSNPPAASYPPGMGSPGMTPGTGLPGGSHGMAPAAGGAPVNGGYPTGMAAPGLGGVRSLADSPSPGFAPPGQGLSMSPVGTLQPGMMPGSPGTNAPQAQAYGAPGGVGSPMGPGTPGAGYPLATGQTGSAYENSLNQLGQGGLGQATLPAPGAAPTPVQARY